MNYQLLIIHYVDDSVTQMETKIEPETDGRSLWYPITAHHTPPSHPTTCHSHDHGMDATHGAHETNAR